MTAIPSRCQPTRHTVRALVNAMLLGVVALTAAACGEDESAAKIQTASIKMVALSPGGVSPLSAQARDSTYRDVITTLQPVVQEGGAGQQAAAHLLIAEAQAGLSKTAAKQLQQTEREAYNKARHIRSALERWHTHVALLDAALSYDPQPELEEIASKIEERQRELQSAMASQDDLLEQARDLRRQAAQIREQGDAARLAEANLRERMLEGTAQQAAQLTGQFRDAQQRADRADADAAFLDVRADQIDRKAAGAGLEVERLQNQIQLLAEARDQVKVREARAQQDADEARRDAQAAATLIEQLVTELEALRNGPIVEQANAVRSQLESAISSAGRARSHGPSRVASQILTGRSQQTLGDFLMARARGLAAWTRLLDTLASSDPALPGQANYAALVDDVRATLESRLAEACSAYESAQTSLSASGTRDSTTRERIERINATLARYCMSEGELELLDETAPADEATPANPTDDTDAMGAADSAEVEAIRAQLADAIQMVNDRDVARLSDFYHTATGTQAEMIAASKDVSVAELEFDIACLERFGEPIGDAVGERLSSGAGQQSGPAVGAVEPDLFVFHGVSPEDFQILVEGDTATVIAPNGDDFKMQSFNDRWMFDASQAFAAFPEELLASAMPLFQTRIPNMIAVYEQMTREVRDGRHDSIDDAAQVLGQRLTQAMLGDGGTPTGQGGG